MLKHNICVLIIESEADSLQHMQELLMANPLVADVESAADSEQALLKIIYSNPDLVLMEYPAKGNAGKELIKFIQTKLNFTTIAFVSRSKEYAASAIQNGIYNYLLKPVSKEELEKIASNVHLIKQNNNQSRINQIIDKTPEKTRLRFQTTKGYLIVDPEDILFCKADGICSELYLTNNRVEMSYLFISQLDEILGQFNFLRVSRSCLINQKYIRKIYKSNNTIILSSEGEEHEIKSSKLYTRNLGKFDI